VIRDVMLFVQDDAALAYGVAFALSAAGLVGAALILTGLDIIGFARDSGRLEAESLTA
jgi:hypothetical protein